jgi:hypothetical protein
MELVTIDKHIYQPTFDPQTGQYRDVSPFRHRSRNNPMHECRCQVGSYFTTNSQFTQHCKKKTHRTFVDDYDYYYKDADLAKQEIKDYRIENEKLKRRLERCEGIIRIRDQEIDFLNGIEEVKGEETGDIFVDCR